MADFLIIDGVVYDVLESGADEQEPESVGDEKRAIDGTLRSSVQFSKEQYRFALVPLAQADYLTLAGKCNSGNFYACSGAAIVAGTYRPRITSAAFENEPVALTFRRAVSVTLRRV